MFTKKNSKLIVKDANGNLVQILPEICIDDTLDIESVNPVANSAITSKIQKLEVSAEKQPTIKIVENELDLQNIEELKEKSVIAWLQPEIPSWSITVDADRYGQIPFCLYGISNASMIVHWGDGSSDIYLEKDSVPGTCIMHEYASPGEYTILMESNDFDRLYLYTNTSYGSGNPSIYLNTLKSINTPLPHIAGVRKSYYNEEIDIEQIKNVDNSLSDCFDKCSNLESIPEGLFDNNINAENFDCCFRYCSNLESIPEGLFDNNILANSFESTFYYCSSLQSIPEGLFDNNTGVTSFRGCFCDCSNLESIPAGLFDKNTEVATFDSCFSWCYRINAIPKGLFDNNTEVTSFSSCFSWCSLLDSIPETLFKNNTKVTNFSSCFYNCDKILDFKIVIGSSIVSSFSNFVKNASGVTRIMCIPEGSTTHATAISYKNTSNNVTLSVSLGGCLDALIYTINTEATTTGEVIGEIPLTVVDPLGTEKLFIDWDDGNGAEIIPSQFADNSTHIYAVPGEYQITVASVSWDSYALKSASNAETFQNTVISIDNPLPPVAASTINELFKGCEHLETIHPHLLENLSEITEAIETFSGCISLEKIPASLLKTQVLLQNASSMFNGCSAIQYIPSGLLSQCPALTNTSEMFKDCTSLAYCSTTLLTNNTEIINQSSMFSGCSNLETPVLYTKTELENNGYYVELYDTEATHDGDKSAGIPYNLYNQSITLNVDWGDGTTSELNSSNYAANNATASVHQYSNEGLYFVVMQSTDWTATSPLILASTYGVTSVYNSTAPIYWRERTLIEATTALPQQFAETKSYSGASATSLSSNANSASWFYNNCTKLKKIPSNIFANNSTIESFYCCFYNCSSLKSISSDIFATNALASDFGNCFYNCSSLQAIPSGLFASNTSATSFYYCFQGCTSIQSIPAGLFDSCTETTNLSGTFKSTSIQSIPAGLFDSCTLVTTFYQCFFGCASLTTIPAGLFRNNTEAKNFYECFRNCTSLRTIPAGLFDSCTEATSFYGCFRNCYVLQSIPAGLFDNCTKVTSFYTCFCACLIVPSIPEELFVYNTEVTSFEGCFYDCREAINFSLHIGSSKVTNCSSFVRTETDAVRTIYVPANSTTYNTFTSQATNLRLTIVGE